MIRKPEPRREGAIVAALRGVVTHGPAVLRAGPLLLQGAVFGCFALYLGFEILKGGVASVGLPALVLPFVSTLALATAGVHRVARALGASSAGEDPRPSYVAIDERVAEAHRMADVRREVDHPAERPFGRRGG